MGSTIPPLTLLRTGPDLLVRVGGPLNSESLRACDAAIASALDGGCAALRLDLSSADYIDSDGVRWLQRVDQTLQDRGVSLMLCVPEGSRVLRALRLLRLENTFAMLISADPPRADGGGARPASS